MHEPEVDLCLIIVSHWGAELLLDEEKIILSLI